MQRLALLLTFLAASGTSLAQVNLWEFDVHLNDRLIGAHSFEVTHDGDRTTIVSNATMKVKLLFVTVFDYKHTNTEQWSNGCLEQFDADTVEDREQTVANGRAVEGVFKVSVNGDQSELAPSCVMSFAYWNPIFLDQSQLLNPQTGSYDPVNIRHAGQETISAPYGETLADRYEITTEDAPIRIWYDAATKLWLALESDVDGRTLRYTPRTLPSI